MVYKSFSFAATILVFAILNRCYYNFNTAVIALFGGALLWVVFGMCSSAFQFGIIFSGI